MPLFKVSMICLLSALSSCSRLTTTEPYTQEIHNAGAKSEEVISTQIIDFETDEGSWMNLDVAPDGRSILFDMLGDIYRMPIEGGRATPVLRDQAWNTAPRYSPDGSNIAFLSDADGGMHNLWIMDENGKNRRQLSQLNRDIADFAWAADSRSILLSLNTSFVTRKVPFKRIG